MPECWPNGRVTLNRVGKNAWGKENWESLECRWITSKLVMQ